MNKLKKSIREEFLLSVLATILLIYETVVSVYIFILNYELLMNEQWRSLKATGEMYLQNRSELMAKKLAFQSQCWYAGLPWEIRLLLLVLTIILTYKLFTSLKSDLKKLERRIARG